MGHCHRHRWITSVLPFAFWLSLLNVRLWQKLCGPGGWGRLWSPGFRTQLNTGGGCSPLLVWLLLRHTSPPSSLDLNNVFISCLCDSSTSWFSGCPAFTLYNSHNYSSTHRLALFNFHHFPHTSRLRLAQNFTAHRRTENKSLRNCTPKWDIYMTPHLQRQRNHCGRRAGKTASRRRWMATRKWCFLDTAGQWYIKIHRIYDSMLKTCADSGQTKISAWGGEAGKVSPWVEEFMAINSCSEKSQFFFCGMTPCRSTTLQWKGTHPQVYGHSLAWWIKNGEYRLGWVGKGVDLKRVGRG